VRLTLLVTIGYCYSSLLYMISLLEQLKALFSKPLRYIRGLGFGGNIENLELNIQYILDRHSFISLYIRQCVLFDK